MDPSAECRTASSRERLRRANVVDPLDFVVLASIKGYSPRKRYTSAATSSGAVRTARWPFPVKLGHLAVPRRGMGDLGARSSPRRGSRFRPGAASGSRGTRTLPWWAGGPPPRGFPAGWCGRRRPVAPRSGRRAAVRVRRRRAGVVVGHRPIEVQVSVDVAVDALDSRDWRIEVAEERPRDAAGAGVDAVVRAVLSVVAV